MARFGPVLTAMVTAFDDDGALDLDATCRLANHLAQNGSDALVLTGTTGEASVLTDEEQVEVWRAVRQAVDIPLVAGSGVNDTAHASSLTGAAAGAGMDAVLLVTPYYNRPGQSGIEAHFRALAAVAELPVMLYDIPVRTGRKIAHETILRLVEEVPNIWALKDAAGSPADAARLIAEAPEGFELYSGDDALTLPLLAVGAVGTISVASHWAGLEIADMVDAFRSGDTARAAAVNARCIPSYAYESSDAAPNPIPTKVMLEVLGLPVGQCRLPLGPPPADLADRARAVLAGLGRGA